MTCHLVFHRSYFYPVKSLVMKEKVGLVKAPAYLVCLKITVTLSVVILRLWYYASVQNLCVKKM